MEDVARPILIPLIAGRSGILNRDMQRRTATWAVKTTMTAEHINKEKAVVQQQERTWLKERLCPPDGWFVWAAPYNGTQWRDLGIFQHTGKLEIPSVDHGAPTEYNLGLTFFGVGHLFFLVKHTTWSRLWDILSPEVRHLHRIWPPSTDVIEWPPPYVFSDVEAEYFTTYLTRVLNERV